MDEPAPPSYCECGCGQQAPLAKKTNAAKGWVKGQPLRFVHGHNRRKPRGLAAETIDHIDPLSRGINNGWENLTAACGTCNYSNHDSGLLLFLHRRATGSRDPLHQRAGPRSRPVGDARV